MEVLHYFKKKLRMNIQICLITAESFTCSQARLGSVLSVFFFYDIMIEVSCANYTSSVILSMPSMLSLKITILFVQGTDR